VAGTVVTYNNGVTPLGEIAGATMAGATLKCRGGTIRGVSLLHFSLTKTYGIHVIG